MRRETLKINMLAVLCFVIVLIACGCSDRRPSTQAIMADCEDRNDHLPILPSSARECLLETVGIYSITSLEEMVYLGGSYNYLGVGGAFGVNWGSIFHSSFILRKDPDAISWDNAKVYKWLQSDWVIYGDSAGVENARNIRSLTDLLSLPERVFTNLLVEVESSTMASVWTREELELLEFRKASFLTTCNITSTNTLSP